MNCRKERDSLGEKEVPLDAYYGVQTQRALENFPVSDQKASIFLIRAYIKLKKACASANMECGKLDEDIASHIIEACYQILQGGYEDEFVVDVFQAGAGTSFNMNVNEVVANLALEIMGEAKGDYEEIHPNDHVNMSQSTNDTFPTASHIGIIKATDELLEVIESLSEAFQEKGKNFLDIGKAGRTHLMDATPITLGDEFLAYANALNRAKIHLKECQTNLLELPIGGTATGAGDNTPENFRKKVLIHLSEICNRDFKPPQNSFEAAHSRFLMKNYFSTLCDFATELNRIANDLRLLASGPKTGLAEIKMPEIQPGSSIMPGKVNPVMAECLNMICFQILGRERTVSLATQAGQLEMNVMVPIMSYNILDSIQLLINYLPIFESKCVGDLEANKRRCEKNLRSTPALVTLLSPKVGYNKAAELARESEKRDISIIEVVKEKDILTKEEIEEVFDFENIVRNKYRDVS